MIGRMRASAATACGTSSVVSPRRRAADGREPDGPRQGSALLVRAVVAFGLVALQVAVADEDLQVVVDGRRRGQADGPRDLADGRRIPAGAQGRRDEVQDLELAFGVVLGHSRLLWPMHHTERTFDVKVARRASADGPRASWLVDSAIPNEEDGRAWRAARRHERRRSTSRAAVGRSLTMMAFLPIASRAPLYARLAAALAFDDRMPIARKALLPAAAAYIALGRDLIPDDIPIIGGLDDLIVLVLAVEFFFDGVPEALLHEKLDELGIERAAFEHDMAQIRRLTPGPVRRTIRRLPVLASDARHGLERLGLGPRIRAWINKEESIA